MVSSHTSSESKKSLLSYSSQLFFFSWRKGPFGCKLYTFVVKCCNMKKKYDEIIIMMVITTVTITTVVLTLMMCSYPHQEKKNKEVTLSELVLLKMIKNDVKIIARKTKHLYQLQMMLKWYPSKILKANIAEILSDKGLFYFHFFFNLGSLTMFVVRSTNVNGSSLMVTLIRNGLRISTVYWMRTSYSPCPMENVLAYLLM